jgi:hypothetical protein
MAKSKPKLAHPSLGVNEVKYDPVNHTRSEKRGILELKVSKTEYSLKQFGRLLPDEAGQTEIMLKVAVNLVRVAESPLSEAPMTLEEMLTWAAAIDASWGSLSLPALAAHFILTMTAIEYDIKNRKKAQTDKFIQILAFASAWHALHMEVFGGHALAYGKAQHAAGQTKGAQTTAQNGAMRATIIRTEIENLRSRVSDPSKMKKLAFVANEIRSAANAAFAKEGLSASASNTAFERLVRRVMAAN